MSKIIVSNVTKTFKVAKRNSGLRSALKSFFKREYVYIDAVKDINFSIEEGEIVGYIGPNGAGKSTTIKMLSGILTPSSGSILVDGLNPVKDRKKYVSSIGVVFGNRSQFLGTYQQKIRLICSMIFIKYQIMNIIKQKKN